MTLKEYGKNLQRMYEIKMIRDIIYKLEIKIGQLEHEDIDQYIIVNYKEELFKFRALTRNILLDLRTVYFNEKKDMETLLEGVETGSKYLLLPEEKTFIRSVKNEKNN